MRKLTFVIIAFVLITFQSFAQSNASKKEEAKIMELLQTYKTSINQADTTIGEEVFLTTDQVDFIHPRGHEKGWGEIKKGIYEMFGSRFTASDLKSFNETITIYDNMAVVVFYWVFDATFSGDNPTPMQSKGRESQILRKIDNKWKIVHVHYSGMPTTGERVGF